MKTNLINHASNANMELISIPESNHWLNWIVVGFCLILIVISKQIDFDYIKKIFKTEITSLTLKKTPSISLTINYLLITSLFTWQGLHIFNATDLTFTNFTLIFISFIVILSVKFFIIYVISNIFNRAELFHLHIHLVSNPNGKLTWPKLS